MEWSPVPDFSLASALAVILTLGMIEKTKETDLRFTLLLFVFNLFALKIALTVIFQAYWPPEEVKVEKHPRTNASEIDVVSQEDDRSFSHSSSVPSWLNTTKDPDPPLLNWSKVWTMLGDLTALMARSRFLQLNIEPNSGYMVVAGSEKQIKALGLLMMNAMKGYENGPAFVDFIDIEPSHEWIQAVEDFLSPRPTSHKELMLACLDYLNPNNIDCLDNI
ncbi:uncharacterized protein PG986_008840 [Apiospora aurea]|uniref:Uncharacterized protein n=1 Tax=Apiospora aurea TaxID=335848 RepID=A0ABR1Q6E2_9PEZI